MNANFAYIKTCLIAMRIFRALAGERDMASPSVAELQTCDDATFLEEVRKSAEVGCAARQTPPGLTSASRIPAPQVLSAQESPPAVLRALRELYKVGVLRLCT